MRLLDLFCGAGGAAMGYHQAGFTEIVGVDIELQSRYPFTFVQGDALDPPVRLEDFDLIHASPPCQAYSKAMAHHRTRDYGRLIDQTRSMIGSTPYVIENVVGAPIPTQPTLDGTNGVLLCGTSFGLRVLRHRLFESSFPVSPHPRGCQHPRYSLNPYNEQSRKRMYEEFGKQPSLNIFAGEVGLTWMKGREISEAIPPAYTRFIGEQFISQREVAV